MSSSFFSSLQTESISFLFPLSEIESNGLPAVRPSPAQDGLWESFPPASPLSSPSTMPVVPTLSAPEQPWASLCPPLSSTAAGQGDPPARQARLLWSHGPRSPGPSRVPPPPCPHPCPLSGQQPGPHRSTGPTTSVLEDWLWVIATSQCPEHTQGLTQLEAQRGKGFPSPPGLRQKEQSRLNWFFFKCIHLFHFLDHGRPRRG